MKLFRLPVFVIIGYALVLLGCGQKGPLTLPEKQSPQVITKQDNSQQPSQEATASQAKDENSATEQGQITPSQTNQ